MTDYTYNSTQHTCSAATNSGLGCHATGAPDWDLTFLSTACTNCHTDTTTAAVNPTSGLHKAGTLTSSTPHDDSFATGGTCTTCHTAVPAAGGVHMNGGASITANDALPGTNEYYILTSMYTDAAADSGTCSGATAGAAGCHDSIFDAGSWARKWSLTAYNSNGSQCANCHGGFNNDWTFGSAANTTDFAVSHTYDWNPAAEAYNIIGNHRNSTGFPTPTMCNDCHVYTDSPYSLTWGTGNHGNNKITMNSTLGYSDTNKGCTSTCHTDNTTGHTMESSANATWATRGELIAGPAMSCSTCHSGITTHTDADGVGSTYIAGTCTDCHTNHTGYRSGTNAANDVYISTIYSRVVVGGGNDTGTMVPTMDDQYASHDSFIQLGGTATDDAGSFSSEAAMCWGCHAGLAAKTIRTATTITFTTNTIVDSGSGFGSFVVGDFVTITGSSVPANNKTVRVSGVAAGTLTFAAASFTADATAGESVTVKLPVSEWRTNTDTKTGSSAYDYGMLFADASTVPGTVATDWTTGYWRSGKGLNSTLTTDPYWYKRGKVRSTHSANYDGTTAVNDTGKPWKGTLANTATTYSTTYNRNETLDTAASIRCSYCHDVHGTHNNGTSDVAGTPDTPYLRGSWIGNLYAEDGAPRWNMSIFTVQGATATTTQYGVAPRSSADPNNTGLSGVAKVGGFWIDQNSGNPTSAISGATALDKANNSSGLCEMCHGANKTGTWTAAGIGALDQITGEALWVSGLNGHNNAVIGAAGVASTAANIFTRTKRGAAAVTGFSNSSAVNSSVDMGLATQTSYGVSYRQSTSETTGYRWKPWVANTTDTGTTASRAYSYRYFAWNTTNYQSGATYPRNFSAAAGTMELLVTNEPEVATETAHNSQANYHTFTCSKCHNPHASRLPKLMITNCLDTNHNTWEDKSTYTQGQGTMAGVWAGLRHSQWPSAQNCHRLDARAVQTGVTTVGTGWNKVTPWIEDTTPNPASASGKTADITTQIAY